MARRQSLSVWSVAAAGLLWAAQRTSQQQFSVELIEELVIGTNRLPTDARSGPNRRSGARS